LIVFYTESASRPWSTQHIIVNRANEVRSRTRHIYFVENIYYILCSIMVIDICGTVMIMVMMMIVMMMIMVMMLIVMLMF